MKKLVFLIGVTVTMIFTACNKNEMSDNSLNVNTQAYENQLSQDYTKSLQFHEALSTTNGITSYNMSMYKTNDSLFSDHYYKFCKDMMQNSGMMSGTNGMMGGNTNMMGSGGMMNGGTMGSSMDMNKMMNYMDSVYQSGKTMMNAEFMKNDSLLHNQMTMCKMMVSQTEGVNTVYNNMQTLRKNHKMQYGN
jgi:hypothetical protein